jgi:hypothetical protein
VEGVITVELGFERSDQLEAATRPSAIATATAAFSATTGEGWSLCS